MGFFCTISEKNLIDVVLADFKNKHLVVTSKNVGGNEDDE
jgi:hypothetical protein